MLQLDFNTSSAGDEAISHGRFVDDQWRNGQILLELPSEATDRDPQIIHLSRMCRLPHRAEQMGVGENPVRNMRVRSTAFCKLKKARRPAARRPLKTSTFAMLANPAGGSTFSTTTNCPAPDMAER